MPLFCRHLPLLFHFPEILISASTSFESSYFCIKIQTFYGSCRKKTSLQILVPIKIFTSLIQTRIQQHAVMVSQGNVKVLRSFVLLTNITTVPLENHGHVWKH